MSGINQISLQMFTCHLHLYVVPVSSFTCNFDKMVGKKSSERLVKNDML